jgi:hypothetical protein
MSNRLGGRQGTAYLGTNANQPPNWTFNDRDPNQYDIQNVSLGDMWLNQDNETVWILVSLDGDMSSKGSLATWTKIDNGGGTGILDSLTGDTGGAIPPDVNSNINLVSGIVGLSFDGNSGSNTITLNSTGGIGDVVQSITGNSGGAIAPVLGNITIVGDDVGINITGDTGTHTLTVSLIGGGEAIQVVDPDIGTPVVPTNGTIDLIAGTTSLNCGSSVYFSGATNVVTLNVTDSFNNTVIGLNAGNASITGINNTVCGASSGMLLSSVGSNTIVGSFSGRTLSSGALNTLIGSGTGPNFSTGLRNVIIGSTTGSSYTSSESDNIIIGAFILGTAAESNVLRIGRATGTSPGYLNKAFIQGIYNITPSLDDTISVVIDSNGQLGTESSVGTGPAFHAYLVNAFSYTPGLDTHVIYDTLDYNRGSAFNLGTSTFTAPVTGLYNFSCGLAFNFGTSSTAVGYASIVATNYSSIIVYDTFTSIRLGTGAFQLAIGNATHVQMDMGDTAYVLIFSSGGSLVSLSAASSGITTGIGNFFSGVLV